MHSDRAAEVGLGERLAGERSRHRHLRHAVVGIDRQKVEHVGPGHLVGQLPGHLLFRKHDPVSAEVLEDLAVFLGDALDDHLSRAELLDVECGQKRAGDCLSQGNEYGRGVTQRQVLEHLAFGGVADDAVVDFVLHRFETVAAGVDSDHLAAVAGQLAGQGRAERPHPEHYEPLGHLHGHGTSRRAAPPRGIRAGTGSAGGRAPPRR